MRHFVTHFDINYAPQGLSLLQSLRRHVGNFVLWVVCLDEETHRLLSQIDALEVRLLSLKALETEPLRSIKSNRSAVEYYWTLTPFLPTFVFDADETVSQVTYLDADTYLLGDPAPSFEQLAESGGSVLITEHAYDARYDQTDTSGRFCVQFIIFNRARSQTILDSWQEQCLEWCFALQEPGRFGDQMYLDSWPTRFPRDVVVARNPAWFLAPWNAARFGYGDAILYHFHGLKLLTKDRLQLTTYYFLPDELMRRVYEPYRQDFRQSLRVVREAGFAPLASHPPSIQERIRNGLGRLRRAWRLAGGYVSVGL
jgi:hypothetical protein